MFYLYLITILINNKKYTGQTIDPATRWRQHIYESKKDIPPMIINRAMKKHCFTDGYFDPTKCTFEVIACCMTQEQANDLEELLIIQENTHIRNKMGYNVSNGGSVAPKTEQWKKQLSNWHASLSPEEKAKRSKRQSEAMFNLIATKGHPAQGTKRTPEQLQNLSKARKEHPVIYTPEIRKRLSDSHIGKKQPEELIQKRVSSIKVTVEKRTQKLTESGELKCNVPNCDVNGRHHYIILDGIRYCSMHGQRIRKTGSYELLPRTSHNKGKKTPEWVLQKMRGRIPHNKRVFTQEELVRILDDTYSIRQTAREFGVTDKVIARIRKEHKKP